MAMGTAVPGGPCPAAAIALLMGEVDLARWTSVPFLGAV